MPIPDDMSELVDVNIDRVDLVGKAANGHRFILAKSSAESSALIPADMVRELIKEADADTAPEPFSELAEVLKAGRALSSANEAALRNAADAIQKVLASLPAPEKAPVEKETPVAEETTETPVEKNDAEINEGASINDVVAKLDAVAKAGEAGAEGIDVLREAAAESVEKADAVMPVYDNTGQLVGFVKPNSLTPVASAAAEEETSEADAEEAGELEAAAEEPTDEVQPDDGAPTESLADDEALIPGTETIQTPVEKSAEPVTQAPDVAALLKEYFAPLAEKVAAYDDLAKSYELLKERVETIGREPDDRNSPKLNGATGTAGVAKRSADTDELATLAKSVEIAKESGDPTAIANAQQAYAFESIKNRFQN
ncbi:hypothetical protein ACFFGR_09200 [Arthrobacter liuii]|uniref:Uncharacterized protein n=1 Tax=Arthrobacter liuii TaxID=1476996 RepID=A0ABQ2APM2_9MICC|nr:hypothetical protein [Arthrobacter liuii]GGH93763.1 hypothetical protein GCM10007170_15390 [Arthrobacter liuii]